MAHEISRFNHFDTIPSRLQLVDPAQSTPEGPLRFIETRGPDNPDLGVFLCNLQAFPEIARMRDAYDERLATDMPLQQMFYEAIPSPELHSTILRIGTVHSIDPQAIMDFCQKLGQQLKGFSRPDLVMGNDIIIGDGIIFTIEPKEPQVNNPLAVVRQLSLVALQDVGMTNTNQTYSSEFTAHSTDRYARALTDDRSELQELLTVPPIEPANFQPDAVYVAVNWPARNETTGYGSYPYRVIARISFDTGEVMFE
jgi:hypothetical protein